MKITKFVKDIRIYFKDIENVCKHHGYLDWISEQIGDLWYDKYRKCNVIVTFLSEEELYKDGEPCCYITASFEFKTVPGFKMVYSFFGGGEDVGDSIVIHEFHVGKLKLYCPKTKKEKTSSGLIFRAFLHCIGADISSLTERN